MGPYCQPLCDQPQPSMSHSQDTSSTDLFSDDDVFDELPSLPIIALPQVIPTNDSLPNLLAQACGTEDYQDFTSVRLKVVASQTSLQRLYVYLPNLIELDLTGSFLQSLRTLGPGLECLRVLRVGRCSLTDLDGLFGLSNLKELYAPNNSISYLGLLATLPHLTTLDLSSNPLSSVTQVSFLKMCDRLENLVLTDCPVSELQNYRASIIALLPRLVSLDGVLLAQSGTDTCGGGSPIQSDNSDGEDGASALPITVSSPENHQKNVSDTPDIGKRRRPETAHGPRPRREALPPRPSTAVPKKSPLAGLTASGALVDPEGIGDSVSELTSGGVVCGNLTAALRGKRNQRKATPTAAWDAQEGDIGNNKVVRRNGLNVSKLYSELEVIEEGAKLKGGGDGAKNPLLEASRQWREDYHSFRDAKKDEWGKENDEG